MKHKTYITLNATNHRNSTCRLQHYIPKEIDLILFLQILSTTNTIFKYCIFRTRRQILFLQL